VYGYGTKWKLSFSLGQHTIAFQTEVYAIKARAVENLDRTTEIEISVSYLIVKLQLKHFAVTIAT
jgi:hypothetical protein